MLKRKIEKYLGQWKEAADRKPLVITGIRQCGKTYIVQKFATENYESVVDINFMLEPDKKSAFHGNIDVDTIILNLSALIPGSRFINGKTCIILDEIQECKEARTSLKSFCIDGRFDIIATGSLLGVKGYGKTPKKDIDGGQDSVPVGYETVIEMFPLDFEEFLWANGINDSVIDNVKTCFDNEQAVAEGNHKQSGAGHNQQPAAVLRCGQDRNGENHIAGGHNHQACLDGALVVAGAVGDEAAHQAEDVDAGVEERVDERRGFVAQTEF